jgi:hypothetical protein
MKKILLISLFSLSGFAQAAAPSVNVGPGIMYAGIECNGASNYTLKLQGDFDNPTGVEVLKNDGGQWKNLGTLEFSAVPTPTAIHLVGPSFEAYLVKSQYGHDLNVMSATEDGLVGKYECSPIE